MKFKINKNGEFWAVQISTNQGYKEKASNLTRIEMIELISSLTYKG